MYTVRALTLGYEAATLGYQPSNAFRGRVADDDHLEFTLRMTWNSKLPKNYGTYENSSKIIQNPMVAASRFFLSWLAPFQLGIPVPF